MQHPGRGQWRRTHDGDGDAEVVDPFEELGSIFFESVVISVALGVTEHEYLPPPLPIVVLAVELIDCSHQGVEDVGFDALQGLQGVEPIKSGRAAGGELEERVHALVAGHARLGEPVAGRG